MLIFAFAYWDRYFSFVFFGRIEKNQKVLSKLTDLYRRWVLDLEFDRDRVRRRRRVCRRSVEERLEELQLRLRRLLRRCLLLFLGSSVADSGLSEELLSPESRLAFTFRIISFNSSSLFKRASSARILRSISALLSALSEKKEEEITIMMLKH